MATSGFQINGTDVATTWPDKAYLMDRYPELADTFKQAGLWAWGNAGNGQTGDGTNTERSSPVQTVAAGTNWKQVSHSWNFAAAIKTDGTLWMWGANNFGQLGTNSSIPQSSPVQTISGGTNWKLVSAGSYNTAAIKTDGTLWTWGYNNYGTLGDNSGTDKYSPVQTIAGGTNWKQVSCGKYFAITAAIKTDGTLWTWGYGGYGALGNNSTASRSSPAQTIAAGTNWKLVDAGAYYAGAIKTDGTLWLWGRNQYGQLGDGTTVNKSSPVQTISAGNNWKQLSCGFRTVGAIKTDGTLWLWGRNQYGQMADNTSVDKSSPVQTVAGGTNWKSVAMGREYTGAIKTDGTLWMWGYNANGQLGNNTAGYNTMKSSPVQTIAGGTNWKQVACGYYSTVTIRDDSSDPI